MPSACNIAVTIYELMVVFFGTAVLVTFVWTITGHCCGSPVIGTPWDSCLPAQDKMWPEQWFSSGYCDPITWRRAHG